MFDRFAHSAAKAAARSASIVDIYRHLSRLRRIPKKAHYVATCGSLGDEELAPLAEPVQLHVEGLLDVRQYHGIEVDRHVHDRNVYLLDRVPEGFRPNLHRAEIGSFLARSLHDRSICPVIVNVDLVVGPKKGAEVLSHVLSVLNSYRGWALLLAWNVVLEYSIKMKRDFRDDMNTVRRQPTLMDLLRTGGWRETFTMEYGGATRSSGTTMRTTVWWRKA